MLTPFQGLKRHKYKCPEGASSIAQGSAFECSKQFFNTYFGKKLAIKVI
jgi:hypothetical protein